MLYSFNPPNRYQGWSCGRAEFIHQYRGAESHRYIVAVRCRLGNQAEEYFAMLDTAADRSIIAPDIAEMLDSDVGEAAGVVNFSSRFGVTQAPLRGIAITLLADQGHGENITIHSTCAFPSDWPGPKIVLGFSGFLEHIRFALEPSQGAEARSMIYFGKCSD